VVLFECFIDLCQAFNSVDHEEGLAISEDTLEEQGHNYGYAVGCSTPSGSNNRSYADREGGFHGPSFRAEQEEDGYDPRLLL